MGKFIKLQIKVNDGIHQASFFQCLIPGGDLPAHGRKGCIDIMKGCQMREAFQIQDSISDCSMGNIPQGFSLKSFFFYASYFLEKRNSPFTAALFCHHLQKGRYIGLVFGISLNTHFLKNSSCLSDLRKMSFKPVIKFMKQDKIQFLLKFQEIQ